jgi:hypothetical protein
MRKIRNENKYKVFNKITGHIYALRTSFSNAVKQIRLLRMKTK